MLCFSIYDTVSIRFFSLFCKLVATVPCLPNRRSSIRREREDPGIWKTEVEGIGRIHINGNDP